MISSPQQESEEFDTIFLHHAKKTRQQQARRNKTLSLTLKVNEGSVASSEGLALADDDGGMHGLLQLGLSLLHARQHHVSDGSLIIIIIIISKTTQPKQKLFLSIIC
jgi:hypothetical protein